MPDNRTPKLPPPFPLDPADPFLTNGFHWEFLETLSILSALENKFKGHNLYPHYASAIYILHGVRRKLAFSLQVIDGDWIKVFTQHRG